MTVPNQQAESRDTTSPEPLVTDGDDRARRPSTVPIPTMDPPRRLEDVDIRRLANPSRMLRRPGWLWRMVMHLLFRRVTFEDRYVRDIREAGESGDVVFVMNHHSVLDYLYFNYAFRRLKLPLVFFANQISLAGYRPLWRRLLRGFAWLLGRRGVSMSEEDKLSYGLERGLPALLFMKKRGLWPWSPDHHDTWHLKRIIADQRARIDACPNDGGPVPRNMTFLPQLLVWNQNPDRFRSRSWDMVFGNPEVPGRLRKAINFVLHRRLAFVQLGRPVDLMAFLEEQDPALSLDDLAAKLRFRLGQALSHEERVIKGPLVKRAKRMCQEIVRTAEMQTEIARIAETEQRRMSDVQKTVHSYLKEMAADFRISYIEMVCMTLTLIFDRTYSEIVTDMEGLDRVRDAGREAPVILLPCHRSHVDYLVISYLFYANGLIAPHIAAGSNMNFWPLGPIFRRCGAFFLRRRFGDDATYRAAFSAYVTKLMREGYWVEFFPEGGRSRTGKMLPPKLGMLGIILDAIRSGTTADVQLVPIYVGYEQIIEERAYTRELSGAEKERESITSLLRTTKVLWSKYGRLYVNFGEPMSARKYIAEAGIADVDSESPEYTDFVRRMGYRILDGIQKIALVTPSAVVSMALLMHPKRGIHRDVLIRRVGFLLDLAASKQAPLSKTLEHAFRIRRQDVVAAQEERDQLGLPRHPLALGEQSPVAAARGIAAAEAIDEVLQRYVAEKIIRAHSFDDDMVYTPEPTSRISMDFYKNNMVHLLVREAILAAAIRGASAHGAPDENTLRTAAYFLSVTFKFEFVYDPERSFDSLFDETLAAFEEAALVTRRLDTEDPSVERLEVNGEGPAEDMLALLHQVIEPWLESYWLLAMGIQEGLPTSDSEMTIKDFLRLVQKMARRRFQVGDITCPEAGSSVTFKHAMEAYESLGYVELSRQGRDRMISPATRGEGDANPIPALADRLRLFFAH